MRRIPWKVVLPAVMSAGAVALFRLDGVWLIGASQWDNAPLTTARGLAAFLLGPVSLLFSWRLSIQLLGTVAFWSWLGFLLDRRLRGIRTPVIQARWARGLLYSLGLILACLLGYEGLRFRQMFDLHYLHYLWRALRNSASPSRRLLGHELVAVAQLGWGLICAVYFSIKLWFLVTSGDIPYSFGKR
jgi:hypothetical protein